MPSFEEEAFERARQMLHNRRPAPPKPVPKPAPKPQEPPPEPPEPPEAVSPPPQKPPVPPQKPPNMLEVLFKDKETSLILILLLLLMDEKNDPTLIFSLMYLLM